MDLRNLGASALTIRLEFNITALATVPEPATLWLSALGLFFGGLYSWKRRDA